VSKGECPWETLLGRSLSRESLWVYVLRQWTLDVEGVLLDFPLGDLWGSTLLPSTFPGSSWRSPLAFHLVALWNPAVSPTIGFWRLRPWGKVAAASSHCKSDLVHGVGRLSVVARWQRLRPAGKRNLHHVGLDLVKSWSLEFVKNANSPVRL
jgi:hypothetical protein